MNKENIIEFISKIGEGYSNGGWDSGESWGYKTYVDEKGNLKIEEIKTKDVYQEPTPDEVRFGDSREVLPTREEFYEEIRRENAPGEIVDKLKSEGYEIKPVITDKVQEALEEFEPYLQRLELERKDSWLRGVVKTARKLVNAIEKQRGER